MKLAPPVQDAVSQMEGKARELTAAKELVRKLELEYLEAREAIKHAQLAVDATLPQCRLVQVHWRSGKEADAGRVVIIRKTPGGQLVVRKAGEVTDSETKFKWREFSNKYVEAKKTSSFTSDQFELRDVPAEFLGTRSE